MAAGPQSSVTIAWIARAPAWTAQLKPCPVAPSLAVTVAAIRYWQSAIGPHGTGIGTR